jgi:CheY-like chemotaxis protein
MNRNQVHLQRGAVTAILIVHGEDNIRTLVTPYLQAEGCAAHAAKDGPGRLATFRRRHANPGRAFARLTSSEPIRQPSSRRPFYEQIQ